jgi:hypothetical protein
MRETKITPQSSPNEVLLAILFQITTVPEDRQKALKHVSLASRRLLPLAQEAILAEPCVRIHRIHALIDQYRRYPSLRRKVTTLEVRGSDQEGCACTYQNGIVTIAALQAFSSLIQLLPNIRTLLLGANQLKDITPLHFLFAPSGSIFCTHHCFTTPSLPNPMASLPSHFYPDVASRIITLELPAVWTQIWRKDHYHMPFEVFWQLQGFTALKHLTMSFEALCSDLYFQYLDSDLIPFPESLESLTISNVGGAVLRTVLELLGYHIVKRNRGSELRRINIWTHARHHPERGPKNGSDNSDLCHVLDLTDQILAYVAFVAIHYDGCQSDWIRKTLMARERNGRPMREVEYFGRESRGCFERFGKEAEEREMDMKAHETWLEEQENEVYKARREVERKRIEKEWVERLMHAEEEASEDMRAMNLILEARMERRNVERGTAVRWLARMAAFFESIFSID